MVCAQTNKEFQQVLSSFNKRNREMFGSLNLMNFVNVLEKFINCSIPKKNSEKQRKRKIQP
jgi:hypothetical protein